MIERIGLVAAGIALAAACGGSVDTDPRRPDSGVGGSGGIATGGTHTGGKGGTGGHFGGSGGTGGKGGAPTGGNGGTGGYIEPDCPDAAAPPPSYECDPFGPNTCDPGDACYPYVIYPSGPCEHEQYGTSCSPQGTGTQNEPCGSQGGYVVLCAPGHDCFITGQGTECLKLCDLTGPDDCPPGLLCGPTDVEGFGACN